MPATVATRAVCRMLPSEELPSEELILCMHHPMYASSYEWWEEERRTWLVASETHLVCKLSLSLSLSLSLKYKPGSVGGAHRMSRLHGAAWQRSPSSAAILDAAAPVAPLTIRQHKSAQVSTRQHTSSYVSIRQHTSTYVSIREHTELRWHG
jgi:hypothetical protein